MEYECRKCLAADEAAGVMAVMPGEVAGGVAALSEATVDRPLSWQYNTAETI